MSNDDELRALLRKREAQQEKIVTRTLEDNRSAIKAQERADEVLSATYTALIQAQADLKITREALRNFGWAEEAKP